MHTGNYHSHSGVSKQAERSQARDDMNLPADPHKQREMLQTDQEDEDDEDLLVFSERPNEQIPVPHKMEGINQKFMSGCFPDSHRQVKNESHVDSKYQTEDSFKAEVKEFSAPDQETPHSRVQSSTSPLEDEFKEETSSWKEIKPEGSALKNSGFNNESPIAKSKSILKDFSDIDMRLNTEIDLDEESKASHLPKTLAMPVDRKTANSKQSEFSLQDELAVEERKTISITVELEAVDQNVLRLSSSQKHIEVDRIAQLDKSLSASGSKNSNKNHLKVSPRPRSLNLFNVLLAIKLSFCEEGNQKANEIRSSRRRESLKSR